MAIYPNTRPDFYQKKFDVDAYSATLQELSKASPNRYLCVTEQGWEVVNVIRYIWENVKGRFGFENSALPEKVHAEWLKFLHYGLMEGFLKTPENIHAVQTLQLKVAN